MGISANQARLMTLTSRMHDLEHRAQQISNTKVLTALKSQALALEYSNALNAATDIDVNGTGGSGTDNAAIDAAKAAYEAETFKLSKDEKLLDLELSQINTEYNAVTTEYDSVKSLISDNTDKSFSVFS